MPDNLPSPPHPTGRRLPPGITYFLKKFSYAQPNKAIPANAVKGGPCGKPGGPNSGSIPSVPGYKIAASAASQ